LKNSIYDKKKIDLMVDAIDKQLLDILKDNSRLSFADLGRKINLSPSAVRERVQKMEDIGVIQKYHIQIDNKKLGYELEAFILLKVFPGQLKHVLKKITDFPEIKEAHRITGNQNLHLKVVIKNQLCLQKLLDQLMIFGDTNTFLILSEI
jgi:Lrp/AsnC family leucine-responsive transcriptional regulator